MGWEKIVQENITHPPLPPSLFWWSQVHPLINPIPPGLFWSSWAWGGGGGGASKAPLHKSECINAIVMKLGD